MGRQGQQGMRSSLERLAAQNFFEAIRMNWQLLSQCSSERVGEEVPLARHAKLALVAMLIALAGCAGFGLTKDSPPEAKRAAVTERVNARWAAIIKGDMDTAYTFFSPATRQLLTVGTYRLQARGSGFRKAEITSVTCEAEVCQVAVVVTLDHRQMPGLQSTVDETWVLDNGQYWYTWRN